MFKKIPSNGLIFLKYYQKHAIARIYNVWLIGYRAVRIYKKKSRKKFCSMCTAAAAATGRLIKPL